MSEVSAPFKLAILGRPNVGKSTLFNRLVGKKLALVDDTPGVTRDRREGHGKLGDLHFTIIDTAGLEEAKAQTLEARMREQTERALEDAHAALFVIDSRVGITPTDRHIAKWARKHSTPIILIANKAEGATGRSGIAEAYSLGLGDPIPLSAEHGEGMHLLYEALLPHVDAIQKEQDDSSLDEKSTGPLMLAIAGRPNVGKSTLVNKLLGQERLLTGPEAGITRDSIAVEWSWKGRAIRLTDTAGMRRRARVTDKLEKLSVADTLRAIRFAEVVVVLMDAEDLGHKQDMSIARDVVEEGRALVVAVNKWDLIPDPDVAMRIIKDRLEASLPQAWGVPVVYLSAKTGQGIHRLLDAALQMYDVWNTRIPTSPLNRWLMATVDAHPPPSISGRPLKIRYATQAKTRPPTFALFVNRPTEVPETYIRYLTNSLREAFNLWGVPLRITPRGGKNPYAPEK